MKITIFAGFSFGLGDLSFGRKTAEALQIKYPNAEITIITDPSKLKSIDKMADMQRDIPTFNKGSQHPVLYLDEYEKKMSDSGKGEGIKPDLIVVGPVLEFELGYVDRLSGGNKGTPVFLMPEHDLESGSVLTAANLLKDRGFSNVTGIPTGVNPQMGSKGMFIDASLVAFDKESIAAKEKVFQQELPATGSTILDGQSVVAYTDSADTSVSYSHNNAERLIAVHAMTKDPSSNVDLIIMGEGKNTDPKKGEIETENRDRRELVKRTDYLLDKGFGQVVYQELGKEPEILGQADNGGPTYRIVHTGRVTPSEAISLRKIGGSFGGATGDQSLAEAISSSDTVIYETAIHKRGIAKGLELIANDVDSSGKLERVVHLLTSANKEDEYKELSGYLKEPKVRDDLKQLRTAVLKKNLNTELPETVSAAFESAKAKQEKEKPQASMKEKSFLNTIKDALKELFFSRSASKEKSKVVSATKPTGTSQILGGLGVKTQSQLAALQKSAAVQDEKKAHELTKIKEVRAPAVAQVKAAEAQSTAVTPRKLGM
jgi:hypothetical protein